MPAQMIMSAGRLRILKDGGGVVLDTDARMPARLGEISTTVTLDWPVTDGEYNEWLPQSGLWRHRMYQTQRNTPVVLGAYPASLPAPQFYWCRYRLTQSLTGTVAGIGMPPKSPRGVWLPWVGSVLLEHWGPYLMRHCNLAVVGGNLVVEMRQSTTFKLSDFNLQSSTRSTMSLEIKVAWGIFDA